uniref:glycerophosphodiester phosphodiesterase n=1 Tax=Dunaliella tertiolecta TaxID=3047 RepID=A0A7S3VIY4_DUNTE
MRISNLKGLMVQERMNASSPKPSKGSVPSGGSTKPSFAPFALGLHAPSSEEMQRRIAIGGHRGHGSNLATRVEGQLHPSFRENTLKSCQKAAEAGASFVEFDLQVTADGVVVLWHDDQVIFTGPEGTPLHRKVADLTLAQFKALTCGESIMEEEETCGQSPPRHATPLLRRFDGVNGHQAPDSLLPWVVSVDDELPTLDAIFNGLPEHVGLNLEVKMAMPNTCPATPPEEVDRMVTPILECVQRHTETSSRGVTFSSFDPDVCVALKSRQSRYPVVFLSGMGLYPHADARRTSIEAAINHAASAQLAGIVAPASVLLANQGMVAAAKAANLALMTYGRENNEPENVRQQAKLGVKGAILDEVEHVVKELEREAQAAVIHRSPDAVQYQVGHLDVGAPAAIRVRA